MFAVHTHTDKIYIFNVLNTPELIVLWGRKNNPAQQILAKVAPTCIIFTSNLHSICLASQMMFVQYNILNS